MSNWLGSVEHLNRLYSSELSIAMLMTGDSQMRSGSSTEEEQGRKNRDGIEKKIENILKEYEMSLSEDQLWRGLGVNRMRKSDLKRILRNLEENNKIIYRKGSIVWAMEDRP